MALLYGETVKPKFRNPLRAFLTGLRVMGS